MSTNDRDLYPEPEAAARLGISPRSLRRLRVANKIHSVKIGSRVLISRAEIERIAREGIPTDDGPPKAA